jgi:hypothetical protein
MQELKSDYATFNKQAEMLTSEGRKGRSVLTSEALKGRAC